ncbi:hypothetical protein [Rhodoferax saidenbachensis]|uniref:hypothetical protein n=1 Tax=Rhodoferax saidenbachensis TaxID=1484693 RepID=UPI0012698037|nr:hypothetical protein [Rhodoferax saidenbachensis]
MQAATSRTLLAVGLFVGLSACIGVAGAAGSGGDTWQEEVLLHDGQTVVVQRSQTYRGRFEPGSSAPVGDHTVRFVLPREQREWSWTSDYGPELGRTNFNLVAIHAKDGVPYIVATPNLCLSYNKWGRPNPPYVLFKGEDNGQWKRITMEQLPAEFTTINVAVSAVSHFRIKQFQEYPVVPAAKVREFNSAQGSPEYKTIVREPMTSEQILSMCDELVNYKGYWIDPRNPFARRNIDDKQK